MNHDTAYTMVKEMFQDVFWYIAYMIRLTIGQITDLVLLG